MSRNFKMTGMMLLLKSTVLSMTLANEEVTNPTFSAESLNTYKEEANVPQPSHQETKTSSKNYADDFFRGEKLPSMIASFYAAAYNPNNPIFEATDEKDEQGRTIYVTTVNGVETGERYAEEIDKHGRMVGFTPLQ